MHHTPMTHIIQFHGAPERLPGSSYRQWVKANDTDAGWFPRPPNCTNTVHLSMSKREHILPPPKKVGHLMKALVWRNWWWSCYKIDEVRSFHWMFYFKLLSDKFMFLTQISFTIIRCLIWVWDINWKLGINTYEMNREAAILGSRRNWTV